MIAITSGEYNSASTMLPVPGAIQCDALEDMTGADVMISPINLGCSSRALIEEHIEAGAVLGQIKRGADLVSSIEKRSLYDSFARMRELTQNKCQRWLFATGIWTDKERDGTAWLDGRKLSERVPELGRFTYRSIQTGIRHWQQNCGYFTNVPRVEDLVNELLDHERDLIKFIASPTKDIYPPGQRIAEEQDNPLVAIRYIKDWRLALKSLGIGFGEESIEELYKWSKGNWGHAQSLLTDLSPTMKRPKGITLAKCQRYVEISKLNENQSIGVILESTGDDY